MAAKEPKLIREIKKITNNPDMHFWIKCKLLTNIETYNRPGSSKGEELKREFFETCAGRLGDWFKSAYVRPYLNGWNDDRNAYDYVKNIRLNGNRSAKIGRDPRGIKLIRNPGSPERFARYLRAKFPEAFETFEEIRKVEHHDSIRTEKTNYCAWNHIFGDMGQYEYRYISHYRKISKEIQDERRELDLGMEKAQADYNELKKVSKLPPRYLYNEVSLADLQNNHKNHTYAKFRSFFVTTETVLNHDSSNVYHGLGKLVCTDRAVIIRDKKKVVFSKTLKTYSGNFILNAIEEYLCFKVEKIKIPPTLRPVQLNPKMKVIEIINMDNSSFRSFKRLFAGVHYDYCVLRGGITYHGTTLNQCYAGWKKKKAIADRAREADGKKIDMKYCRRLGFCESGVKGFCAVNGLDSSGEYTIAELKRIVKKKLWHNKDYYGSELRQVGIL